VIYNNVGFIFAREGSKGLPNKNILDFCGKPLIQWSIETILKSKMIDKLIVSTDSRKIADLAINLGAHVPFIRPKELASDQSPEIYSWRHAINYFHSNGDNFKTFISLPCTSPLRTQNDIENAINFFNSNKADLLISIYEADRNPFFNMVKIKNNLCTRIFNDNKNFYYNRQNAPKVWNIATVIYIANPDYILKNDDILSGNVLPFEIPRERSIDIDTKFDFEIAEFLMRKKLKNGIPFNK
jgi:CMP-N-acetylneuraminic acid synthetase